MNRQLLLPTAATVCAGRLMGGLWCLTSGCQPTSTQHKQLQHTMQQCSAAAAALAQGRHQQQSSVCPA